MNRRRAVQALLASGVAGACAGATLQPTAAHALELHVVESTERAYRVGELTARHDWTVLVFFSATCPTVTAHDPRLKDLWRDYNARGIGFYAVASEADFSRAQLASERARRGYPFPLLWDRRSELARALNVRYASQVFVLGQDANVAYAGSIDSDRRFLHRDAEPYLRRALDALTSGSHALRVDPAAYGCALQLESSHP